MPTVLPYATSLQAANATTEILSRWRANTLSEDPALLMAQVHLVAGFGLSVYPGSPGDPAPLVPIGSEVETLTFGDAERRIQMVLDAGGVPVQGSMSWLTVAIRVALKTAATGLEEPLRSAVLAIIDKVF